MRKFVSVRAELAPSRWLEPERCFITARLPGCLEAQYRHRLSQRKLQSSPPVRAAGLRARDMYHYALLPPSTLEMGTTSKHSTRPLVHLRATARKQAEPTCLPSDFSLYARSRARGSGEADARLADEALLEHLTVLQVPSSSIIIVSSVFQTTRELDTGKLPLSHPLALAPSSPPFSLQCSQDAKFN